jgi:tRNA (guanine37-N1)-methyltransferase
MTFSVLTIFPGTFKGFLEQTMMKLAIAAGAVTVNLVNIRDYATDKHQTTDDTPYGGGPGMVMKIEPIYRALQALKGVGGRVSGSGKGRTALLSARGKQFDQRVAETYAKLETLTLICGRYEGVDQRV